MCQHYNNRLHENVNDQHCNNNCNNIVDRFIDEYDDSVDDIDSNDDSNEHINFDCDDQHTDDNNQLYDHWTNDDQLRGGMECAARRLQYGQRSLSTFAEHRRL